MRSVQGFTCASGLVDLDVFAKHEFASYPKFVLETAARRLHEAVERGDRPRCCVSIGAHQSNDPDHLRSTRPSNLDAICRRSDQRNQWQRASRFRDLRTRSYLPKHSRVQREDFEFPETAHRLGTRTRVEIVSDLSNNTLLIRARRPPTRAIQVVAAE
jgi:hypothetical protein